MLSKRVLHLNQKFTVIWAKERHERLIGDLNFRRLFLYIQELMSEDIYADVGRLDWIRVSQTYLRGISRSKVNYLWSLLKGRKHVTIERGDLTKLFSSLRERDPKLKKDKLLRFMILKDERSLACNVLVWSEKSKMIGHIELLRAKKFVEVVKFIKRGEPITNIPILINYSRLLSERTEIPLDFISCRMVFQNFEVSFHPSKTYEVLTEFLSRDRYGL
ncbi:MAG: hypothetical protein ACTSWV_05345 [Candidatus Asgardarchaeia archaeon]